MNYSQQVVPAIAAIIFNEKGEVLLQKRKDVNKWCIISGHVEFGETLENAVLREIQEETNVKARILRFIGVYSAPESQTYTYTQRAVHYITSYFEAQLLEPLHREFSNNETLELKFFQPENIPKDLALMNPNWLLDALSSRERVFVR